MNEGGQNKKNTPPWTALSSQTDELVPLCISQTRTPFINNMAVREAVMSPDETSAVTFHTVNTLSHSSYDGGQTEHSGTNHTPLNAAFVTLL